MLTTLARNLSAAIIYASARTTTARDVRAALDYDLSDIPAKECDARLYRANMAAFHKCTEAM